VKDWQPTPILGMTLVGGRLFCLRAIRSLETVLLCTGDERQRSSEF
jgi:hypothetical protein